MKKKNVYLIQASFLYGNTYYLPYAIGMLAAFAFADPYVREHFELKRLIYKIEDIDESISHMEDPAFVGFSNSIWNYRYNLEFAKKLKERYSDCIVEFGGHHVPPTTDYLKQYAFIDVLIHGKGEEAFRDILRFLDSRSEWNEIPNISFRDETDAIIQTPQKTIDLVDYPSPYLTGIFDSILQEKEYPFSCVIETNRGCPFNCSYCDWGELNSKVRLFPLEKVFAELEWISKNKISFVYCVDANFGMFERDEQIAEKIVELKEATGFPNRLQVSYAKNEPERVFRINKLLSESGIGKGATLALQSLNPTVLKNVGRNNISKQQYADQVSRFREAGIPTYTELILGLPGETLHSFCTGLCELLELGQHSSVSAYYCEVLPNSRLARKDYIEKHGIQIVSTALNQYHCEIMQDDLPGTSSIIVGTNSMSVSDWIEANVFSTCVQSFHHFGLLQCIAIFLRVEKAVSYYMFYSRLLQFIRAKSTFMKSVFDMVFQTLNDFVSGRGGLTYQNDLFGTITYPLEEAVFLLCNYYSDLFYEEAKQFASGYFEDTVFMDELFRYQKAVILKPNQTAFCLSFSYDFKRFFDRAMIHSPEPLKREQSTYIFDSPFATASWVDYAREIIWYGRRNGRMMYSNKPNTISRDCEMR